MHDVHWVRYLAGVASIALAVPALAQAEPAASGAAEDIVVTGIRASLEQSVALKREASNIIDAISAEDIGELPDENVAESIQRITGIQITRDGGEGKGVNIRGLSAQILINGRVILGHRSDGLSARDFDFRSLSADFVQTIEVSKTPLASMPEGALGGTVNLITRRPLDQDRAAASISGDVQYSDFVDSWDPSISGYVSHQFAEGVFGVSLGANWSRRGLRTDNFLANGGWTTQNVGFRTGFDFNRDGVPNDVLRANDIRLYTADDTRTRYGFDGSVQWRPSDELELRLDGNFSRFVNIIRNHFFRTLYNNPNSFVPGSLVISDQGSLLGGSFTNQGVQIDGRYEPEPQNTWFGGGNARWQRGALIVEADASYTRTKRDKLSQFLRFQSTVPANVRFAFSDDRTPPDIILSNADGSAFDLFTPSRYVPDLAFDRIISFNQDEWATRLDVGYEADVSILRAVRGGVRATWRDVSYRIVQSANQPANTRNPAFFDQATGRRLTIADSPLNQFTGPFPFDDGVFSRFSNNFPRSWLVGDYPEGPPNVGSREYLETLKLRDFGGLLNSNAEQSDISENTIAG